MSATRPAPEPRDAYRAFRPITTRWMDNDQYGHVNNVVYYSWFDTAVNAHLIEQGVLDTAAGATIGLVVETQCHYFAPLSFPQSPLFPTIPSTAIQAALELLFPYQRLSPALFPAAAVHFAKRRKIPYRITFVK